MPQLTNVRYNDWRGVELPPAEMFAPTLPVTVVVSYFEAPDALVLTLAALEGQTYPRDLLEVIVVDDGSRTPLKRPATSLDLKVVRQEHRGFGLARARNNGVRAAMHDILVFLDGDMIASAGLLAAHARWHHAVSDAVTMGIRHYVSVEDLDANAIREHAGDLRSLFEGEEFIPPWRQHQMASMDHLASRRDGIYGLIIGGNFGIGKALYQSIGGCDESFTRYGGEDIELAYRAYVRGALFVPLREAHVWHQGRWEEGRDLKTKSGHIQRHKMANLIAHPDYRHATRGRIYEVPQYVVTIESGEASATRVIEVTETVLGDPIDDLVVRIETSLRLVDEEFVRINEEFRSDPRVQVSPTLAALDGFPASPFHVILSVTADFDCGLVMILRTWLGEHAMAQAVLPDGSRASIVQSWALHRTARTGRPVDSFGDTTTIHVKRLAIPLIQSLVLGRTKPTQWDPRSRRVRVVQTMVESPRLWAFRLTWLFLDWVVRRARRCLSR